MGHTYRREKNKYLIDCVCVCSLHNFDVVQTTVGSGCSRVCLDTQEVKGWRRELEEVQN